MNCREPLVWSSNGGLASRLRWRSSFSFRMTGWHVSADGTATLLATKDPALSDISAYASG